MSRFTLDVDAGNTCLKWRVRDAHQFQGCIADRFIDELRSVIDEYHPERVFIASVRDEEFGKQITDLFSEYNNIVFDFLRVDPDVEGLKISYRNPATLGVDRWLAAIGAHKISGGLPSLIIDAGSAVTIDTVADGQFMGGYILPGFKMLQASLLAGTSRVKPEISMDIEMVRGRLPQDTLEAVRYGASMLLCAGIEKATSNFRGLWPHGRVLVTGGYGERIAQLLEVEVQYFPNLVLDGIPWIRP